MISQLRNKFFQRLAASHIAGPSPASALEISRRVAANEWGSTFCCWNGPDSGPPDLFRSYSELLDALPDDGGTYDLSLKAPSFHYNLELVQLISQRAALRKMGIEFDSHGTEAADPTHRVAEKVRIFHDNVVCAVPARWSRSIKDVDWAAENQIGIRIVKGQWPDPANMGIDFLKNYIAIVERAAARRVKTYVATHNPAIARESLRILQGAGCPCALEVMFSLPLGVTKTAKTLGVPVRVYIPYGYPYLPYNLTHVHTRPAVALWAMRNFVFGRYPRQRPLY